MNNSFKWHYSIITLSGENKTTVVCDIEGGDPGVKHLSYHVPTENLPYVLNTHENASLNVCNIWDESIFDADQRNTDEESMETAKNTILF